MSDPSEPASRTGDLPESARWRRWALVFGLPSAAVALVAAWVVRPHGTASTTLVAALALAALGVFVGTMPRRRSTAGGAEAGSRGGSEGDHTGSG